MANHHDWIDEVKATHERDKPFAPENGRALKFAQGDKVIYTNDAGATFERVVTGLCDSQHMRYIFGARYHLDSAGAWIGYTETELTATR